MAKHRVLKLLLAIMLGAVNPPSANAEALRQSNDKQQQSQVIGWDLCLRKLDELLGPRGSCRALKSLAMTDRSIPDLSGIWRLTVEGLDIWAPPYTLVKTTGRIHWRLAIADGELSLFEHDSAQKVAGVRSSLTDATFEQIDVREVIVRDDLIALKVAGEAGAYEAYWLENFSSEKITGTYTVYDLYGGGPGRGPEYRARLLLQKVE